MENRVTLKELSKLLNVSISTVSKALRDSPEISPETRKKVKELAELNQYVPNALAQNLKNRKTKTIGVIIPSILPHFFAKALHGIETKAAELGYGIIICISNESREKEAESIKRLMNGRVDGLILSLSRETQASKDTSHIMDILKYRIPLVLFDRVLEEIDCDKVSINDALQAEQATIKLFQQSCRKIVYCTGISNTSVDDQRKIGYLQALESLKLDSNFVEFDTPEVASAAIQKLLKQDKMDAVLASDELSAILAMKSILKSGYRIPEDVAIIGFTNGSMSEHFVPSLTTVDQHAEEQGSLALETMVDRIEGKLPADKLNYKLETSIIQRDSTLPE
ncbi:LacI family DNA-binding transcriptional regulator [Christiangramia flava]|uniref:LacI family transcriptional regulator n=1 Tax=Christiangramia flava JLT2011 TaxID=1229726 RepID=A0A1L7I1H4_9FLAO|nr:LacI family DNA-binding transcriptional regulator [Christiangramia flava]APU66932.1 LacI family transcriptional regulator [Christiangramia flava JLT2011]OSS38031.1 LacI family transcriptional regulator [Christiangramia flava JLT2011]